MPQTSIKLTAKVTKACHEMKNFYPKICYAYYFNKNKKGKNKNIILDY